MLAAIALVLPIAGIGWAARCTTAVNTRAIQEYESYVRSAEEAMPARFAQGRLSTASADMRRRLLMDFEGGAPVRWNISQPEVNRRAAEWNGTVIDWVGAIHIRDSSLADLRAVLEDFDGYATIYKPLIYDCRARKIDAAGEQRPMKGLSAGAVVNDVLAPAVPYVAVRIGEAGRDIDVELLRPRFVAEDAAVGASL